MGMIEIIGLLGLVAFVVASLIVGGRVLLLAINTRQLPEITISLSMILSGGIGTLLVVVPLLNPSLDAYSSYLFYEAGSASNHVGFALLFLFVWRVFRPRETWAACLFGVSTLVLLAGGIGAAIVLTPEGGVSGPDDCSGSLVLDEPERTLRGLRLGNVRVFPLLRNAEASSCIGARGSADRGSILLLGRVHERCVPDLGQPGDSCSDVRVALGPIHFGRDVILVGLRRCGIAVSRLLSAQSAARESGFFLRGIQFVKETTDFDLLCEKLEELTSFNRLEARGTMRIALKESGLEAKTVRAEQLKVVVERVLAQHLRDRGIEDGERICSQLIRALPSRDGVDSSDSPEAIFERLGSR